MRISTGTLWLWILRYVIHTITGAVLPSGNLDTAKTEDLSSFNKILILGGRDCPSGSQPWQAALFQGSTLTCGGVLVHPQWVLSAAHCLENFNTVLLGFESLDQNQTLGIQIIQPNISVPHPDLNLTNPSVNDIMLIKLSNPANLTDTVKPITLASQSPAIGSTCLISGWGPILNGRHPQVLQCLPSTVVSPEVCKRAYNETTISKIVCTLDGSSNGISGGDSGGPVVCNGKLYGIVSWVSQLYPNRPVISMDVCEYKEWIEETIRTR